MDVITVLARKEYYYRLRQVMKMHGHTAWNLTKPTKRSLSYIEKRMAGSGDWSIGEAYAILDFYNLPAEDICLYFPEGGKEPKR